MAIVNGSLQEGYKDAAWFAANPTLVLLVGQKVNLEQTGTYKLGDGTTQLSALSFLGASGSGLSGLTTNKVLKASSSTTAGNSNITDDGTTVTVNSEFYVYNGAGKADIFAAGTTAYISADESASKIIESNNAFNNIKHATKNTFDAPLHEFNNSVTKGGVEVATVNDIPSVAGLEQTSNKSSSYTASSTTTYANTKALVDGLATKANNLLAKQNTTITHTGTTAETKIYSVLISAGSVQANDNLKILMKAFGASGVASKHFRMYFNTSDAIGGVQVGLNTIAATVSSVTTRNIFCKNSLSSQQVIAPTTSVANEESTNQNASSYSTVSIDFSLPQYFIISCQLTTGTESASILGLTLQAER